MLRSQSRWFRSLCSGVAGLAGLFAFAGQADASSITPGNLVVVRVGTGTGALSNASTAVFLDEYTTAGAFVQSIALPTAASGTNLPLTNSGSATSEGLLSLSADGQYLVHAGYAVAPGTTGVAGTTSAAIPRVVARVDLAGNIDTSTALNDAFSANNPRSATSNDGTQFWLAGAAAGNSGGGVRYATLGATTSTQLPTAGTGAFSNGRVVRISGGQLYVSSASGAFIGVNGVGTGLPTTTGQTVALLSGFPSAGSPSQYDFAFTDATTLYVADDRSVAQGGGLQKFTFNGTSWSLTYTLNTGLSAGLRGLTAVPGSSPARLYASSADTLSKLVTVLDAGVGSSFSTLATSAANTAIRGVRYVPINCTGPAISGAGQPTNAVTCAGGSASFTVSATGTAPLSYQWRRGGNPLANGGNISGALSATLTINPVGAGDFASYDVLVTNACGTATSNSVTLASDPTDTDGDGAPNCTDGCPNDPFKIVPGVCGCGFSDADGDGDGTADCNDGCPNDPLKITLGICGCGTSDADSDGDGVANCNDNCPNDPLKIAPGTCGCGVSDVDSDGDGTADCNDGCPNDPLKITPGICGCGTSDADSDGDGVANCNDNCPNDPLKVRPGTCGCGVSDADSDGDGTADCNDGCPSDPLKTAAGQCGCGVVDSDSDADGTADCNDGCPSDPLKTAPGLCGCGASDADGDGDGVADCHDNCPTLANAAQTDGDLDGVGDACDNCPAIANATQADCDGNQVGDACEIAAGAPDCNLNQVPDACDIANATSHDANSNGIPDECEQNGGTPYCFGYGAAAGGVDCPCANISLPGSASGCASSTGLGGKLVGSGSTSLASDQLVLNASQLAGGFCIFVQGDAQIAPTFQGDGARCIGGTLLRLRTKSVVGGSASYPQGTDPSISLQGLVPPAGGVRGYEVVYRDPIGSPCGNGFNVSNAVSVIWQP